MSDEDDPYWFLDMGRLPRPLQWWILFSLLPSIWTMSFLPDHERELSESLSTLPWTFILFLRACQVTSLVAMVASVIHTDLTRGRRREGR